LLSEMRTLHRTSFDDSPWLARPSGQRQSRCSNACRVSPSPGTKFKETSLTAGFLFSGIYALSGYTGSAFNFR
jgi:hypothetical protein